MGVSTKGEFLLIFSVVDGFAVFLFSRFIFFGALFIGLVVVVSRVSVSAFYVSWGRSSGFPWFFK